MISHTVLNTLELLRQFDRPTLDRLDQPDLEHLYASVCALDALIRIDELVPVLNENEAHFLYLLSNEQLDWDSRVKAGHALGASTNGMGLVQAIYDLSRANKTLQE